MNISGMEASTGLRANGCFFVVGPLDILGGLVTFCITSIQIREFWSRLLKLGVVGPVDK